MISYIVDERRVTNEKEYGRYFRAALKEDDKAILRILKSVPATALEELGIQTRPDPEARDHWWEKFLGILLMNDFLLNLCYRIYNCKINYY